MIDFGLLKRSFIPSANGLPTFQLVKGVLIWTIPLKEAASLLWDFYRDPLRSLTLIPLNVLSQKS